MTNLPTKTDANGLTVTNPQNIDQNPAAVYLARLAPSGRRTQEKALQTIAGYLRADLASLPWGDLRYQHTQAIRAKLAETYAPATTNKMLAAIRGVLKQAWLLGQMTAEEYQRAAELPSVRGETLPTGREIATGEKVALMAACENDPSPAGARDAAIVALMLTCGPRRHEVAALALGDYDQASGRLVLHGKGRKERSVYLVNGAAAAMADWLTIRGQESGPLFVAINKGGRLQLGKPITAQAVYNMLAKRAAEAGVAEFSPHDTRRTFISDLLDAGADIALVAKMAGHSDVRTTARYDRRPEAAKENAAKLLHIPYRRRLI